MNFDFTDEQVLLRDSLSSFLQKRYPISLRTEASRSDAGWRPDIWRFFGQELGILGIGLDEAQGGTGGGPVDTMLVMEELGAALVLEPFLETVVMAGGLLRRSAGPAAQRALRSIVSGEECIAVGWNESGSRYRLSRVGTTATRVGAQWQLQGRKVAVGAGPWASKFIVTARTSGAVDSSAGISLFLVDRQQPGLTLREYHTIDGRRAADLILDGVLLPADALLGEAGQAGDIVEQAADEATAALCAEALGVMEKMLQDTVAYTRQRRQFGQPISSFQVLQHRMTDMMMQIEMARSAVYGATLKLDADPVTRAQAVSAAKVTVGNAARFVGQNAVQLHGGMGMSDEVAVTHYFRRATVIENTLGTVEHHLARFAALERRMAGS